MATLKPVAEVATQEAMATTKDALAVQTTDTLTNQVSEVMTTDTTQYTDAQRRRRVNNIFRIARGAEKIAQVVAPDLQIDDDLDDFSDDDDDTDDDDDAEDIQDDDEPMEDQDQDTTDDPNTQPTGSQTSMTHEKLTTSDSITGALGQTNSRGVDSQRYKFAPEKIEADKVAASNAKQSTSQTTTAPTKKVQSEETTSKNDFTPKTAITKTANAVTTDNVVSTSAKGTKQLSEPNPTTPSHSVDKKDIVKSKSPAGTAGQKTPEDAKPSTTNKVDPLAPTAAAPYGYKIVKVKKPDGTIGKVKRPLKEGEIAPAAPSKVTSSLASATNAKTKEAPKQEGEKTPSKIHIELSEKTNEHPAKNEAVTAQPVPTLDTIAPVQTDKSTKSNDSGQPPQSITYTDIKTPDSHLQKVNQQRKIQISEKEIGLEESGSSPSDPEQKVHTDPHKHARRVSKIMQILTWAVMLLFPIWFLVLAITTASLNNKEVPGTRPGSYNTTNPKDYNQGSADSYGRAAGEKTDPLSQAIKVAASVWPIVFAAVVAQTLKMYAAYRVERGIQLVTLEQLISSHSVGAAIKQPFMLRTMNWTSILLIIVWALSPLAGQAMLRMSYTWQDSVIGNSTISFYKPIPKDSSWDVSPYLNNETSAGDFDGDDSFVSLDTVYPLFNTLLLSYNQTFSTSQDIWSNLKVPLSSDDPKAQVGDDYPLSSLVGIPFWITNDAKDRPISTSEQSTFFDLNSTYFSLNCSSFTLLDNTSSLVAEYGMELHPDISFHFTADNNTVAMFSDDSGLHNSNVSQPGSTGVIHFGTRNQNPPENLEQIYYSRCEYTSVVVQTSFYCTDIEYSAQCQTYYSATLDANQTTLQPEPLGFFFPQALREIAGKQDTSYWFSFVEEFIVSPTFAVDGMNRTQEMYDVGLANVTADHLSARLGLAINTLWTLGFNTQAYLSVNPKTWGETSDPYGINVTSFVSDYYRPDVYRYGIVNYWIAILVTCSVLLLVAAIAAACWERRVIGPDFLGFANTAIKKSVKMPKTMSTMNARDRLHALQECEVVLHDLKPNAPVGKIVLGVKDDGIARLQKGRQYR